MNFRVYNYGRNTNVAFSGDPKQTIKIGDQIFEIDGRLNVVIEVSGDVHGDVTTMSGDVTVAGSAHDVTTMSGDVKVRGPSGMISTMSGDISTGGLK